jgi:hypothetical protein
MPKSAAGAGSFIRSPEKKESGKIVAERKVDFYWQPGD